MSIATPAMNSAEERAIELRTRPDLVISESQFQGEICWIVKDPLAMKYFRLRKPEYGVLCQLRQQPVTYQQIKRKLVHDFPEANIRLESVQHLVFSLHRSGLLISRSTGQAVPLAKRRDKEKRQKLLGLASSLISLRLPGWDPERFLSWLYPKCRWMFSAWFTVLVFVTCLAAAGLVLVNLETFTAKLPEFQQFFSFDNILFMGLILIVTKTIHEFGHGLMCKHFGGECHEMGFMLLVLMPAMYCNTSDSWVLPNRWHRIAIGAAGMYIELFMAAICTFVWWFTNPGWIHYLALNVMFLSSVSTIVFNANPLLRYDGYYMLSDFLEIPNLSQKSKQSMISKLRVWFLGMKPIESRLLPARNQIAFAIYSVSSVAYRWFVMLMIFWFLSEIFEPYGLAAVGHLLIAISLIGMIGMPMFKMFKFFRHPGRLREVKSSRFYLTLIAIACVLAFVCYFPMLHYVWAPFVVRPQDHQQVLVREPGRLQQVLASPGEELTAGQSLAYLANENLELELKDLEVEQARLEKEFSAYERLSNVHLDAASRLSETRIQLDTVARQIELKFQQIDKLTVRAERSGRFFVPVNRMQNHLSDPQLPGWSGTPLDNKNINAYLEANTTLGMIGDAERMEAVLIIDQSDIKLVQPGNRVVALVDTFADAWLKSEISFVSNDELTAVPAELSQNNGGPIPVRPDPDQGEGTRPLSKSFEAYAQFSPELLAEQELQLLPGMRGRAKILVGKSSLGTRLRRYLSSVINFR